MSDQPIESLAIVPQIEQNLPSDAKNKAISDLTAACYQKASQLHLTQEEIKGLGADFPDEAFQPGAAGKENLIYIEHAALRERLDQVIGMGQWCVIPIRRWEEQFKYQKERWSNNRRTGEFDEVTGSHVYVDGIMLIRGAFVGSAIGEMTYYPDNHTQNYGDAVEGAETAALRRCCKRLGIGLQAWRKDWCAGWWDRRKKPSKPATVAQKQAQNEPEGGFEDAAAPEAPKTPKTRPIASPERVTEVIRLLKAAEGGEQRNLVTDYLVYKRVLRAGQQLEEWPLAKVPLNGDELLSMIKHMDEFAHELRGPA